MKNISRIVLLLLVIPIQVAYGMQVPAEDSNRARYHFTPKGPKPYAQAKKDLASVPEDLEAAKKEIIDYYKKIDEDTPSPYELEFKEICKDIQPAFLKAISDYTGDKKPAVILDVDETVLSNIDFSIKTNFESVRGAAQDSELSPYGFRSKKLCTAIKPMIAFCNELVKKGATLIFISSRRATEELTQATFENLKEYGFPVTDQKHVILMPLEQHSAKYPVQKFKEEARTALIETYEIIGCIGDSKDDWSGEHTGEITVNVPCYLY